MQIYTPMGEGSPEADAALVGARIDGQQTLLDFNTNQLVSHALTAANTQEDLLRTVYRPMTQYATELLKQQQQSLATVAEPLFTNLGTQVATNGAMLSSVVSALPSDQREQLFQSEVVPAPTGTKGVDGVVPTTSTPTTTEPPTTSSTFIYDPDTVPTIPPGVVPLPGRTNGTPSTTAPTTPTTTNPNPLAPMVAIVPSRPSSPGTTTTTTTSSSSKTGCPDPCVTVNVTCPTPTAGTAPTTPEEPPDEPTARAAPVAAPRAPVVPAGLRWDTTDALLCGKADAYVRAFSSVGGEIRTFLFAGLNAASDIIGLMDRLGTITGVGLIFKVLGNPLAPLKTVFNQVGKMIIDYGAMFTGANGDALVGLYFTKGWVKSLNNTELGLNFVITAKVNIDFVPEQTLQIIDYLIRYLHPVEVPAIGDIEAMYLASEIGYDAAVCLAKMQNRQEKEFIRGVRTHRTRLTPDMEVKYFQRQRTAGGDLAKRLRALGMTDDAEQDRLMELGKFIPPPSDAIRFAVKDVFDPTKLGLQEIKDEFLLQKGLVEMLAASGIEKTTITTAKGEVMELDLPLLYHIASYEECSPTQVYQMFHRLRKNRVGRFPLPDGRGGIVTPKPVELDTVRGLLKEVDYNPIWRDRLAAIAFNVPGRIDTRNMYKRGVLGQPTGTKGIDQTAPNAPKPKGAAETELRERYMDMGYSELDSNSLTLLDAIELDRSQGVAGRKKVMARVCKAYKVGGFTYDQALTQLVNAGVDRPEAIEFLGGCDLDMRIADLSLAVNGVKKQFTSAVVSEVQARELLRGYGVAPARVDTLVATWNLYRTNKQRELTAQQVLQFWEEGIVNLADARARLVNLGYDATAANMMLNHVRVGQAAKGKKEAERIARLRELEQRRTMSAAEKERKEREAAQNRRMVRFLALQSEKNLIAWLKAGEVTRAEAEAVLLGKGNNPTDVQHWLNVNTPK